ncbi:hypothetical protein [Streptomyces sp. Da 82-17]|uniref:hypothetical protein n=1 Tax=Streptomyces sp. Da 82-17 TaxID=3377116 RepID=UPI0038D3DC4A
MARVLIWLGLTVATAATACSPWWPSGQWLVLPALGVSLVGLGCALVVRVVRPRAAMSHGQLPSGPPAGFRATGEWWPEVRGRVLFRVLAALAFVYGVVFLAWESALNREGIIGLLIMYLAFGEAIWRGRESFGFRGSAADVLESAMYEGSARVVPVVIGGPTSGRHRPPTPPSHDPARIRDRVGGRVAFFASGLRLMAPYGERILFVDRPVDAEVLASHLAKQPGQLYWAETVGMPPDFSAPAVLVLPSGEYLRGWTIPVGDPRRVEGYAFKAVDWAGQPEVRPLGESILRRQSIWLPGVWCHAAAALPVLAALLSPFVAVRQEAVTVGLVLAPFWVLSGLFLNRQLRTRRLRRLDDRASAPST